jgi:hypothetical protein
MESDMREGAPKKKPFDPSLVDNYEDGTSTLDSRYKPKKKLHTTSWQRSIVGLAICIRPRSTEQLQKIAGISFRTNAIRMLNAMGAVAVYKEGKKTFWGAPHMKDKLLEPMDPVAKKFDEWLLFRGPWPEELGTDIIDNCPEESEQEDEC